MRTASGPLSPSRASATRSAGALSAAQDFEGYTTEGGEQEAEDEGDTESSGRSYRTASEHGFVVRLPAKQQAPRAA